MKIASFKGISWETADPNTFLGEAKIKRMLSSEKLKVFRVSCEAKSRMNWHVHSSVQILLIVEGVCWLQVRGQQKQVLTEGDVALIEAGEEHWHGASDKSSMVHLVVNIAGKTTWGERVNEADYLA